MIALQIAVVVLGIMVGLILRACRSQEPRVQHRVSHNDKLDTVDEMYLFGEVTNDEFYKM